jgi:alpha-L-rhamnosidase
VEPTIAALRKSGQNIVEAEAFTGLPGDSRWVETPAWLKPIGDAAYCAGINRFILHRFTHQPWDDRYKPGAAMGCWGTHFDRTQTWWEPGKAMFLYWQRCQALLQWGQIAPLDFSVDGLPVTAIHRRREGADLWFVANPQRTGGEARCVFKVTGKQPELWDPVTGEMRDLPEYQTADGQTELKLKFDAAQSFFVVFRKPGNPSPGTNFPALAQVAEISGPWEVRFDPKWGGPASVKFDKLTDWTKHPEPGIRYYSGTATYQKTFDGAAGNRLDLGVVNHLARVRLNGRDLGVWANRLIGDEQEPADCEWSPGHHFKGQGGFLKRFPEWFVENKPRPAQGRYCFTTWNYFTKDSPLVPSGLIGPVTLQCAQ